MKTIKVPKGKSFHSTLDHLGACNGAIDWVGKKSFRTAWNTCPRADWMLWIANMFLPEEVVVLAACDCVREALPLASKEPRKVATRLLKETEKWCRSSDKRRDTPSWTVPGSFFHSLSCTDYNVVVAAQQTASIEAWPAALWAQNASIEDWDDECEEVATPMGHIVRARIPADMLADKVAAYIPWGGTVLYP